MDNKHRPLLPPMYLNGFFSIQVANYLVRNKRQITQYLATKLSKLILSFFRLDFQIHANFKLKYKRTLNVGPETSSAGYHSAMLNICKI